MLVSGRVKYLKQFASPAYFRPYGVKHLYWNHTGRTVRMDTVKCFIHIFNPNRPNTPRNSRYFLRTPKKMQSCNSQKKIVVILHFFPLQLTIKIPTTVCLCQVHRYFQLQLPWNIQVKLNHFPKLARTYYMFELPQPRNLYVSLKNASLSVQGAQCCIDRTLARMFHGRIKAYFLPQKQSKPWKQCIWANYLDVPGSWYCNYI